jgi:hypothetical protein
MFGAMYLVLYHKLLQGPEEYIFHNRSRNEDTVGETFHLVSIQLSFCIKHLRAAKLLGIHFALPDLGSILYIQNKYQSQWLLKTLSLELLLLQPQRWLNRLLGGNVCCSWPNTINI